MRRFLAIVALFSSALCSAVAAQQACYRQSECECVASENNLRDGLWRATVEPGLVASNHGQVFVFHADESPLDIISECDGTLHIAYQDDELGAIQWQLKRANQGPSMLGLADWESLEPTIWDQFVATSPELEEFASSNEFYTGENILWVEGNPVPATMLLGYQGLPGLAQERGDVSITVRIGPFQGFVLWARTGKADFQWVGDSQAARDYIREICRCEDAEITLESARLSIRMQEAIIEETRGLEMRKIGYMDVLSTRLAEQAENYRVTPVANERFDAAKPWDPPGEGATGNWPCVPFSSVQDEPINSQGRYKIEFQREWPKVRAKYYGDPEPEPIKVDPDAAQTDNTRAVTDPHSCAISFRPIADDLCETSEVQRRSYAAHEAVHAKECRDRKDLAARIHEMLKQASAGKGKIPGLSQEQAEAAYFSNVSECFKYDAFVSNAHNAALDELRAYKAGEKVVADHVAKYCSP